ncbi:MAG: hypothetical protein EPO26_05110 [Chloroflexota bacterium]|nr:MAG: hypothetical protein EPO26_05110 [Chloroflexota bacterium]
MGLPAESASIRAWVARAPAPPRVRLAQAAIVGFLAASLAVQLIPAPEPALVDVPAAVILGVEWVVSTLWIPVGALVWGRRRRGFVFAALLLGYSLCVQVATDWVPWFAPDAVGVTADSRSFPGARRSAKLLVTLGGLVLCPLVARGQPD